MGDLGNARESIADLHSTKRYRFDERLVPLERLTRVELKYLQISTRKAVLLEQPGWRTASSGGCSCMPSSSALTSPF